MDSPCPYSPPSRPLDALGRPPREPFLASSLGRQDAGDPLPPRSSLEQAHRQPDWFGLGTPCCSPRANPFPEVTDPFRRLPLPTLFHRPQAVHLGDLDAAMSTTGVAALGPPDFQGPSRAHRTPRDVRFFQPLDPTSLSRSVVEACYNCKR